MAAMAMDVKSDYLRGMRRPFVMDIFAGAAVEANSKARGHFRGHFAVQQAA